VWVCKHVLMKGGGGKGGGGAATDQVADQAVLSALVLALEGSICSLVQGFQVP